MKTLSLLFCLIAATGIVAQEQDSIIVVKGQVSDYYISVSKNTVLKGYVRDENGRSLEGATVMLEASPVHFHTLRDGSYELSYSWRDTAIVVYYPGKEMACLPIGNRQQADIQLFPAKPRTKIRHTATATPWFDPKDDHPSTYCNPLNINYNFRARIEDVTQNGSFRSTADPMIVVYKGEYYLFSTNQSGFYWSKNLSEWRYVFAGFQRLPEDDDQCAPAAFVHGDTLFYTGSTYRGLPVWYSVDPKSGVFKRATDRNVLPTWDPAFFLDDDGRLYQYYGSSNEYPLKGVEISRDDFYPVGKITDIMMLHPEVHGWERFGMNNDDSTTLRPFMEGAWVNKHKGRYYFQYGAPGTEFKVYADGVYVSDHPLGPYTYQTHNPMSYKPGGFVIGAGHGGTFADVFGNYWHVATCMISLKYKFERRISLYPAGFDAEGILYANTSFGDYPTYVPTGAEEHTKGNFAGWMLLSYRKELTASSSDSIYLPQNASDENIRTYWSAASGDAGEWLQMDLGDLKNVYALQVNYYEHKAVQYNRAMDLYHQYKLYHSTDGVRWELVADKSDNGTDVPHDYLQLRKPLRTRFLKLENIHMPAGSFAISDFRVFGNAGGEKPGAVGRFEVIRSKEDTRNARITWKASDRAYGYNIYYGIAPGKMYNCITVYGAAEYDFRGMDVGATYYFTIEALGESGASQRVSPIRVEAN
ncbi:MAG: family 43 glycosylhydrolase [Tannerellaceae bacterium]|jgi:hypothetical protein|nr:family 43 glycosylhydrolase [Tannerellaceae bacterium]